MREAAMYQVRVLVCIDTLWIKSPLSPDGVHIEAEERTKLYFFLNSEIRHQIHILPLFCLCQ